MSFQRGFEKIADESKRMALLEASENRAWNSVGGLLSELPDYENPKVGDRVAYSCEIKWTNEPDGKHAGGGWDGYDFNKDGVTIGDKGKVVEVEDPKRVLVAWDKHQYDEKQKTWKHGYRTSDLKKLKELPERK